MVKSHAIYFVYVHKWHNIILLRYSVHISRILQLIPSKYNAYRSYFDDSAHCIISNVARHVAPLASQWVIQHKLQLSGIWLRIFVFFYLQDLPKGQLCRYLVYSRPNFWVFRHAGVTRLTDESADHAPRSSMPNFTLIGPGVGVYGPKNWKNWNFTNIIAPKGRVPCRIFFTEFTSFMRVVSLHNFAKLLLYFDRWWNY